MKIKTGTLAQTIADILTTAPVSLDPEDEIEDETRAKLNNNEIIQESEDEDQLLSNFRRQNVDLLADVDERYVGKKSSRKRLRDSDEESSEDEDQSTGDISNSETEEESDAESDEYEDRSEGEGDELEDGAEDNFKHIKETDVSSQVKKGLCVRNQMSIWENLLEMRIQIQKCLVASNKMPQNQRYQEIKKESGQEFLNKVVETKQSVSTLLDKLLLLQNLVVKKYPETKNIHNKQDQSADSGDEEIASDTDNEGSEQSIGNESEDLPRKKRKLTADYERDLNQMHNVYKTYRNSVIEKWHEKTRLAILKNNTNSHSVINHIEHTLSDRAKLTRRTQLKRSDYQIVGEEVKEDNTEEQPRLVEEYNNEIFDDDDFYHQLLRELIEVKSADLTDPVQIGRQWMQLQNLRSKMKRKIDTRATKGRKIRYAIHTKLVNFMAPWDESSWMDDAKTELFSSLFGKKQVVTS